MHFELLQFGDTFTATTVCGQKYDMIKISTHLVEMNIINLAEFYTLANISRKVPLCYQLVVQQKFFREVVTSLASINKQVNRNIVTYCRCSACCW